MDIIDAKLIKLVNQCDNMDKIIICPYGEYGRRLEHLFRDRNFDNIVIVDNKLEGENVIPVSELEDKQYDHCKVLLASINRNINYVLREQITRTNPTISIVNVL